MPYFASNEDGFEGAKGLIVDRLERSIATQSSYQSLDNEELSFRHFQCDVILFLSVLPLSGVSQKALALYEDEMRFPTGQTTVKPPAMELSGVVYSPDCGTALEWTDERAVKVDNFWQASRVVATVAGLISSIQVWIVLKEMGERGSPSVLFFCVQI